MYDPTAAEMYKTTPGSAETTDHASCCQMGFAADHKADRACFKRWNHKGE